MLEATTLCYGMLASYVLASFSRNRREQRGHPPVLMLFGWLLLSFSAASALMLLGWAGLKGAGLGA